MPQMLTNNKFAGKKKYPQMPKRLQKPPLVWSEW